MIRSVQKAMQILTVISDNKGKAVSLAEISAKTQIPKPTCSRLLETLLRDGYVRKISHFAGYVLGPSTHYLSRYGRYESEMISLIRPVMRWMEHKTGATVILAVIQNNQKYIIESMDNEQNLFEEHPMIRVDDIYRTATGRAILAQMNRDEVKSIWDSNGPPKKEDWDNIESYDDLIDALKKIQIQPIVITEANPNEKQLTKGYACPIFQKSVCVGAIGIAWIRTNESDVESQAIEESLCGILRKGTKEIQRRLSYQV